MRTQRSPRSCSPLLVLILIFPSTLPFKPGHVEQIPGSSIRRSSNPIPAPPTSNSRAAILQKLTGPTRHFDYSVTTPQTPTGYYSHSQSLESFEEQDEGPNPYTSYPNISPFTSVSSSVSPTDKYHIHQRLHHYQRIQRQGLKPTQASKQLGRETGDLYATVSPTADSRYNDLYKKQSATPSSPKPSSSSTVATTTTAAIAKRNNTLQSPQMPPTLLPPSYLSLATFRHIDGTLEKSSSNILSRIATFWRNLSKNVANNQTLSKSSSNNVVEHASAYTKLASDESLAVDDYEGDNVPLTNHTTLREDHQRDDHDRHEKSESDLSRVQPNKYVSIEDNSEDMAAREQYFSLLDDSEAEEDVEHLNHNDNQVDHHNSHHENIASVEDHITSESSSALGSEIDNDSHSFHDDLFHHHTGTITAVIEKHQFGGDLVPSGSSSNEAHESSARSSSNFGNSILSVTGTSGTSSVKNLGDVRRAEEKIWGLDNHFTRNEIDSGEDDGFYFGMSIGGFLKRELWTIPLFVLAALNMVLIILFEVYVLCRARGQSRRHLFLGQMLLFGLFLCSFLALMFAVHPSIVGCFVGRLGVGITYSLIFSVLMVKCVFLLSLDSGVYLPTSYQGILLFFAVAVQVAIDTQWVIMYPPFIQTVESGRSLLLQCGTSFVQLLYSLAYVGFLVLMVGFLAGRAAYKGVVENYREAVYILIAAVVTVPVALSWTVAGWMLQGRHQDACVSFGLVAHSLTTFLIMFMPKGRQLASLDKEAVCFEDQEDQCSGYSPSFFHFKPSTKNYKTTLWGDGNLYTTLEPTVSTINPNVFFHRNDFHSGMIY